MRFLVVVYPGPPHKLDQQAQSYTLRPGVSARFVDAPNAQAAVEQCNVEPGGKAHVIPRKDVETFTRAEKAPLVSDRPRLQAEGEAA